MGMNSFCNKLVEYNGQLVRRCDFNFLTNGLPPIVKYGYAVIILTASLTLSYIFLKLAYKKYIYHKNYNKKYDARAVRLMSYYILLFLVLFIPAILFILKLAS